MTSVFLRSWGQSSSGAEPATLDEHAVGSPMHCKDVQRGQNDQKWEDLEDEPCRTGGKTISGSRTVFLQVRQDQTGSALRSGQKIVKKRGGDARRASFLHDCARIPRCSDCIDPNGCRYQTFGPYNYCGGGVANIGSKIWNGSCQNRHIWTHHGVWAWPIPFLWAPPQGQHRTVLIRKQHIFTHPFPQLRGFEQRQNLQPD